MQNVNEEKDLSSDAGQVSASRSGQTATPRPWRYIQTTAGYQVASTPTINKYELREADAELIVRAVNSHDALVAAAKALLEKIDNITTDDFSKGAEREEREHLRAILAEVS